MGVISDAFETVWRDYATAGVPSSGAHEPVKSEIRPIGANIETAIAQAAVGTIADLAYATKAELDADLAHDDGTQALVYADPDEANNDLYLKTGASGAGSWTNTGAMHAIIGGLAQPYVDDAQAWAAAAEASALGGQDALHEAHYRPNLIRWGPESLPFWHTPSVDGVLSINDVDGLKALQLDAVSSAGVATWNIPRDAAESEFAYSLTLLAKTGGIGSLSGRLVIYQIAEPEGQTAPGFTVLDSAVVPFPSGDVSARAEFTGSVVLDPGTSRIMFAIEPQDATQIVFTQPLGAFGPLGTLREPGLDIEAELEGVPFNSGFSQKQIRGFYAALTGALSTGRWYVNSDGDLQIVSGVNALTLLRKNEISTPDNGAFEAETEVTVTGTDSGAGAIIAFGDETGSGGSRRAYAYLRNGLVGALDNSSALVNGGVVPGMTFAQNERVFLRVRRNPDGTGWVTARNAAGVEHTLELDDIPAGSVWLGWRRATAGKYHRLNCYTVPEYVPAAEARLDALENAIEISGGTVLKSAHLLPDSVPSRAPRGFTATGLDKITRGAYAGCWVVGDDGRLVEGDGSPLDGKIHIVSPDFSAVLFTIDVGAAESVQGVTVDTSGLSDTVWVVLSTAQEVRHYSLDGTEIVGDRFDWAAAGLANDPNGAAYDPANDALWLCSVASDTFQLVSCDPTAAPRVLDTAVVQVGADQLHFDSARGFLYFTYGSNGVDGSVGLYRVAADSVEVAYAGLERAQAIEGLFIDRENYELLIMNDGGFHDIAQPALNLALRYRIRPIS